MEPERDPPFFLSLVSATARELKTEVKPSVTADALVSIDKFNQGTLGGADRACLQLSI